MATAFSTWTSEAPLRLAGCGIDAEQLDRFQKFADGARPWPFVYSDREIAHNRSLPWPAAGFCAAFCCKEALYKALSAPYTFTECEVLAEWESEAPRLLLSSSLCEKRNISGASVHLHWTPWRECVAEVHVFIGNAGA